MTALPHAEDTVVDEPTRDRARTRERILAATEDLLSARSARDLKVRDVASRAGVSASLVVQYFISKDALVLDVGLRRMASFEPPAAAGVEGAVAAMLALDFANAPLMREVLRQSWWWSPETENAFQTALEPRRAAVRAAAPDALPGQVEGALVTYFAGLRRSWVENRQQQDCLVGLTNRVLAAVKKDEPEADF